MCVKLWRERPIWQNSRPSARKTGGWPDHDGTQYTSIAFGSRCQEAGIRPSLGSVGDCFDKPCVRVSLPLWNANCWTDVFSTRTTRPGALFLSISRAGIILIVGTRAWITNLRSTMKGAIKRPVESKVLNPPLNRGNSSALQVRVSRVGAVRLTTGQLSAGSMGRWLLRRRPARLLS